MVKELKDDHIEIDLETLSTKPGGVIVSIGVVRFDPRIGRIQSYDEFASEGKTLKIVLDIADSKNYGFTIQKSTQDWWDEQSQEAKDATFNTGKEIQVKHALERFSSFMKKGDYLWGNGANFDPVMLEPYFDKLGIELPWKFYNVMCFRTLKKLLPYNELLIPPNKIKHDCLYDAVYQAQITQAIYLANPQIKPETLSK